MENFCNRIANPSAFCFARWLLWKTEHKVVKIGLFKKILVTLEYLLQTYRPKFRYCLLLHSPPQEQRDSWNVGLQYAATLLDY